MPTPSMQINPRLEDERAAFEADAAPMGFDLKRLSCLAPEPWSEYADETTGHRWGGWLARASQSFDYSEAVELARKMLTVHDCRGLTTYGVRVLAKSVIEMNSARASLQTDYQPLYEFASKHHVSFNEVCAAFRAALNGADAGVSEGWQDIATAPFGEDIRALLCDGSVLVDACRQSDGDWEWRNRFFPPEIIVGWLPPLPSAPTQGGSHGK